jgi:hypothetical protein
MKTKTNAGIRLVELQSDDNGEINEQDRRCLTMLICDMLPTPEQCERCYYKPEPTGNDTD